MMIFFSFFQLECHKRQQKWQTTKWATFQWHMQRVGDDLVAKELFYYTPWQHWYGYAKKQLNNWPKCAAQALSDSECRKPLFLPSFPQESVETLIYSLTIIECIRIQNTQYKVFWSHRLSINLSGDSISMFYLLKYLSKQCRLGSWHRFPKRATSVENLLKSSLYNSNVVHVSKSESTGNYRLSRCHLPYVSFNNTQQLTVIFWNQTADAFITKHHLFQMLHAFFGESFHQIWALENCFGNLKGQNSYLTFVSRGEHTEDICG